MKGRLRSLVLSALLTSCAGTARITGDFGDYRSYRQVRLATTLETRLANSERYLREYPHGDYYEEVRRWFAPAEKRYFKLSWDNLPRLRAYLWALPHGPHVEAVVERIDQLEMRSVIVNRREQRIFDRAQSFEQRLAQAAEQRHAFLRELGSLIGLLGATRSFGRPTSELDSELLRRFHVQKPPGSCEADQCTKAVTFVYAVPEAQELSERSLEVTLQIGLQRGLVSELMLSGPELLTRVAEAATVRAVPAGNPQARAEALGQALDVVAEALDVPMPKNRCDVESISPIVLFRRCDGRQVVVIAGTEVGAVDQIRVNAERR